MGSAGIEYGVDVALTLEEPKVEKKTEQGRINLKNVGKRDLSLVIEKNRFGPRGSIPLAFTPELNCFVEMEVGKGEGKLRTNNLNQTSFN